MFFLSNSTVKENDEDRIEDESGYNSLNSNRRSQALYELESLQESNERRTPQFGNIAEGERMSLGKLLFI